MERISFSSGARSSSVKGSTSFLVIEIGLDVVEIIVEQRQRFLLERHKKGLLHVIRAISSYSRRTSAIKWSNVSRSSRVNAPVGVEALLNRP